MHAPSHHFFRCGYLTRTTCNQNAKISKANREKGIFFFLKTCWFDNNIDIVYDINFFFTTFFNNYIHQRKSDCVIGFYHYSNFIRQNLYTNTYRTHRHILSLTQTNAHIHIHIHNNTHPLNIRIRSFQMENC